MEISGKIADFQGEKILAALADADIIMISCG